MFIQRILKHTDTAEDRGRKYKDKLTENTQDEKEK